MSRTDKGDAESPAVLTPEGFIAHVRGEATPEQSRLIQAALENPTSELNQWLAFLGAWMKDAFPPTGRAKDAAQSHPMIRLNDLVDFVQGLRTQGRIDDADAEKITVAGGLNDPARLPRTPAQAITAFTRIIETINELHPELADQTASLATPRHR